MPQSVWIESVFIIKKYLPAFLICLLLLFSSCSINVKAIQDIKKDNITEEVFKEIFKDVAEEKTDEKIMEIDDKTDEFIEEKIDDVFSTRLLNAITNSKLPHDMSEKIRESILHSHDFLNELREILLQDPYLRILVDKEHSLGENYEPDDLVVLKNGVYVLNNSEVLSLRRSAADSLEEMATVARSEGITLLVSYSYRSFARQLQSYSMHVRNLGQREADRISARPGYSQHQLGLTVDFDSVTNVFSRTAPGIWLSKNASRFGWSISYPYGYEGVTGYSWESWHYRYVGAELAEFIDKYFNGIQQYALRFIHEFESF